MAGMAPVIPIGYFLSPADASEYIPIYSLECIDMKRSQNWSNTNTSINSAQVMQWEGSDQVIYDVDFELIVGFGGIQNHDQLMTAVKLWHSWGSHKGGGNGASNMPVPGASNMPVPVQLVVYGQINVYGFMKSIATKMKPPWRYANNKLIGTVCQFTGQFMFAPGLDITNGSIVTFTNNTSLAYDAVKSKFYQISS